MQVKQRMVFGCARVGIPQRHENQMTQFAVYNKEKITENSTQYYLQKF